jgi:hypothetical protein
MPYESTSFVGRSEEVAAIARLLADPQCRLLTLLGPGGIGKTRLALAVAADQIATFADGVVFVALAAIGMPNQIISAIGEALRLSFCERCNQPRISCAACRYRGIMSPITLRHAYTYTDRAVRLLYAV